MAGRGCVYRKWGRKGFCVRFTVAGRTRWKGGFSTKTNARRWLENHVTAAERDVAMGLEPIVDHVTFSRFVPRWKETARQRLRYAKADGRRTLVFAGKTLKDARNFARRRLAEAKEARGKRLADGCGTKAPTLAEFLEAFLPLLEMRVASTTFRTHRENLRDAAKHLGSKPVDQVRRSNVEEWLASMRASRNLKPLTLRRHLSTLAVCFEDLVGRGLVERNPCRGIRLPRAEEYPVPYLSPDDLHRIYAACAPWLRPFIVLLGETGLRLGELRSLTWQDISREFDRISVRRSKSRRTRDVPLTPLAREALREIEVRRGPVAVIDLKPVFGEGFNDSWIRKNYHLAVRKAGFERLRLHDLRHAFASSLVRAGVPIPTVSELMGHASPELVLTRYGKHAPSNAGEKAIEALARFRGEALKA